MNILFFATLFFNTLSYFSPIIKYFNSSKNLVFTTLLHHVLNFTIFLPSYSFDNGLKSPLNGTWPPFLESIPINLVIDYALNVNVETLPIISNVLNDALPTP